MNNILVSGILDNKIFYNIDFYEKKYIKEIKYINNELIVTCKENIPNNFGMTIHNLYNFNYEKDINIFFEMKVIDENFKSNIKYYNGEKYISNSEMIVNNKYNIYNLKLNKWHHKFRIFTENKNINKFVIKSFYIKNSENKIIFNLDRWNWKKKSHYSMMKSEFLYNELKNIMNKTNIYMINYSLNDTIDYYFPEINYLNINNINDNILKKTSYLFITNFEYYDKLNEILLLKKFINKNKIIFRCCKLPHNLNLNNEHLYFLQNKTIELPTNISLLYKNIDTIDDYIKYTKKYNIKQQFFVNTMGVSSLIKYNDNNYQDDKIHILFMGRLIRPFDIINFINDIDSYLDHTKYIIDILPGRFNYKNKIYDSRDNIHFNLLKKLFNQTINIFRPVNQKEVKNYIMKANIGIDFPTDINNLSIYGPENCKLYEYISLGLPTISQITPNSYFINKYKCGIELTKISSPKDYFDNIIKLTEILNTFNRKIISEKFINDYSYENLTYILLRKVFYYYNDLPNELIGDWNYDKNKIIKDTPYLKNHKFLDRNRTIKSNWNRIFNYFPEIFDENKLKFLDLSCGNGATLEIIRFMGHETYGIDYESENHCFDRPLFNSKLVMNNKWPYKILLESQKLNYKGHDLNVLPYPFDDNSFNIVNSWGAIEFYGRPKYWIIFILEMLRISINYVNITFNDISPWLKNNEEYTNEYNMFFNTIEDQFKNYNVNIIKINNKHYKFYKNNKIDYNYLQETCFNVDEFISIGGDCSVANSLKSLNLRNFSGPFDWLITQYKSIYNKFKNNFKDFIKIKDIIYLSDDKFKTNDNTYYYHEENINNINNIIEKYNRRSNRLNNKLSQRKNILFIRKNNFDTIENILELEEIIMKKYQNIEFKIFFINSNIKNKYYSKRIIGINLDKKYFPNIIDEFWNYNHLDEVLEDKINNILSNNIKLYNIKKRYKYLNKINKIYCPNFIKNTTNNYENILYLNNINNLPDNSGIFLKYHISYEYKFLKLKFKAKINKKNNLKFKIYTGIKWIIIDKIIDENYNIYEITDYFNFTKKSLWRIGFKKENIIFNESTIYIKDIEFSN